MFLDLLEEMVKVIEHFMKSILITIFILTGVTMLSQNNTNEHLSRLFLDLDLTSSPENMAKKSPLKFEYGINQTVSWGKPASNAGNYVAVFDKHELIKSKIKTGLITIISKDQSAISNDFSINERIWFLTYEDMLNEYNSICSSFEKLGYRVKNTITQYDNFETKSENTEILIKTDSRKSTLIIGYYLPPKDDNNKEYCLAIVYSNNP